MKVAYVINEYPKITHTFVRTEIAAVEQAGVSVERIAIRRAATPILDPADRAELSRTRVVLDGGLGGLAVAALRLAAREPRRFARALRVALRLGRRSPRGVAVHLAYLAEACVLTTWAMADGIEHVHATFGANPAAVALLGSLLGGPPYSFTAHGPEEFDCAEELSTREKVEGAAFIVVPSEAGRRALCGLCAPEHWDRVHVVRCGFDARFTAAPTPPPSAPRLAFVGRLCAEKAPLALIEAIAAVNRSGVACELVIVGDGPLRAEVESRIERLRLGECVRLVGWAGVEDVRRHLLASRALVLPSLAEGLPIVLMEAMALERPVICTPVGGIAELVENEVSGWLVPPGEGAALAAAVRAALSAEPEELLEMGRKGRARVLRQHDVLASGRALAALFAGARRSAGEES